MTGEPLSPDRIDLLPLHPRADATEMLLLARGQLNRAFRKNGLLPPDPLPVGMLPGVDVNETDDPAALGVAHARERYPDAFAQWAAAMPLQLANPVLAILGKTHAALSAQPAGSKAARTAVQQAYDFLLACSQVNHEPTSRA